MKPLFTQDELTALVTSTDPTVAKLALEAARARLELDSLRGSVAALAEAAKLTAADPRVKRAGASSFFLAVAKQLEKLPESASRDVSEAMKEAATVVLSRKGGSS